MLNEVKEVRTTIETLIEMGADPLLSKFEGLEMWTDSQRKTVRSVFETRGCPTDCGDVIYVA